MLVGEAYHARDLTSPERPHLAARYGDAKEFIARAAALETGGDLTRFVADAALRAARAAIEEHGTSLMTDPMRARFYELLLRPAEPSRELIALMASEAPAGFVVDD